MNFVQSLGATDQTSSMSQVWRKSFRDRFVAKKSEYGVNDLRAFAANDLRFLRQFAAATI